MHQLRSSFLPFSGTDKYAVYIDGIGPDGAPLTTDPIVTEFPAGSTLSGMRYIGACCMAAGCC